MPNTQIVTKEAANERALREQTALVDSAYRLFKEGLIVSPLTTLADLEANECDFSSYPSGGVVMEAWTGPGNPPEGGAVLTSPVVNFQVASATVGNTVGGFFITLDGGEIYMAGNFDPPVEMIQVGDVINRVTQVVIGRAGT